MTPATAEVLNADIARLCEQQALTADMYLKAREYYELYMLTGRVTAQRLAVVYQRCAAICSAKEREVRDALFAARARYIAEGQWVW